MLFINRKFSVYLLGMGLSLLYGCQTPTVQSVSAPDPEPLVVEPATESHQSKIAILLDQAYIAFEQNKLTTPIDDNAYYIYLQVLSIDPKNASANQGITEIAEKYLEWAINSAEDELYQKAHDYLSKARSVDESHPNIAAVQRMIEDHETANRRTYRLSNEALKSRTNWLIEELHDIGKVAENQDAVIVIKAPTDREGRWIYQQLNNGTVNRVRATFKAGYAPSVQLIYHGN